MPLGLRNTSPLTSTTASGSVASQAPAARFHTNHDVEPHFFQYASLHCLAALEVPQRVGPWPGEMIHLPGLVLPSAKRTARWLFASQVCCFDTMILA
jgi:hypothetical protein